MTEIGGMKEGSIHRLRVQAVACNGTWGIGGNAVAETGMPAIPGKVAPTFVTPKAPALRLKPAAESGRRTDAREFAFVAESPKPAINGVPTVGSTRRHKLS